MFMLRQTSVKMAVLLHKQANDRFHPLLTVDGPEVGMDRKTRVFAWILKPGFSNSKPGNPGFEILTF